MKHKVIVFDIWASFAYFRKSFTTTTAITFPFIPRSSLEGLIGAIMGFSSEEYPEKLKNAKIGLGIVNEVRKIPFSMMHTHVDFWSEFQRYLEKGSRAQSAKNRNTNFHARVKIELLHEPHFRIYFSDDTLSDYLEQKLRNHQTVFTPYLGSSSMIANFEYLGSYDYAQENAKNPVLVSTIVPFFDKMPRIVVEKGLYYAIEQNIPIHLTNDRNLNGVFSAVYNPDGRRIKVQNIEIQKLTRENSEDDLHIVFIPTKIPS